MVSVRAQISHAKRRAGGKLLLNREIPRQNGRGLYVGLNSEWLKYGAGLWDPDVTLRWQGRRRIDRDDRRKRDIFKRNQGVEWRGGTQWKIEIVQEGMVNPKSAADRCLPVSERVPGKADSGLKQRSRIVVNQRIIRHSRLVQEHAVRTEDELGSPSSPLVPAIRELVPEADSNR